MKVLFTTPILEHPAAGGPQLRIENSIKALNSICDLHVVYRIDHESLVSKEMEKFYQQHCNKFILVTWLFSRYRSNPLIRKSLRLLCKFFPLQRKHEVNELISYVDINRIDLLWFGYGNISFEIMKEVRRKRPQLKLLCDTDSVWSRFVLRELPYAVWYRKPLIWFRGKKKEREEKAWTNFCEVTTAVSKIDAAYYRQLANTESKVWVFSNVIDLATYAIPKPTHIKVARPSIYLAGSFTSPNSPMNIAADWIVDEILPKLRKKIPNIHFYLVGRNSDSYYLSSPEQGMTVTGKVDSVLPYLMNVDVALVPLKFESGTRFKILEAAACKIPIVSTTLGAEGIPVVDGESIFLADDTESFVEKICLIVQNSSVVERLTASCFDLIEANYSLSTLQTEAALIFKYLGYQVANVENGK
jgi:glycosyltransferase involved in cell wall biosynthesis